MEPAPAQAAPTFRPGLDELGRAKLLTRLRLMIATAKDGAFTSLTHLAAQALNVPLTLVSLVTDTEQFFAGQTGDFPGVWRGARSTPLSHSFCQHVANSGEPLIIPDAREHPLVRDNAAIPDLQVVAYLGMPLRTAEGYSLGSFCAIDNRPRQWTEREVETLRGLSALVMVEIESRLDQRQMQSLLDTLRASERTREDRTRLLVHDLRTPLNSLMLGLRTLPVFGDLNEDQQELLDVALRGAQTLVGLVDDLLDTASVDERGVDSLQITHGLDPSDLLAPAMAQVIPIATHRGVTVSCESPGSGEPGPGQPGSLTLDADADKVARALVNLLSNAVKFTPAGGQVVLSLRRQGEPGAGRLVFAVRDTGQGISPEDQAQLFQRFSRVDQKGAAEQRSTGLGLFFVRTVAEAHGGSVAVESEVGRGSTFSLILPSHQPEAP